MNHYIERLSKNKGYKVFKIGNNTELAKCKDFYKAIKVVAKLSGIAIEDARTVKFCGRLTGSIGVDFDVIVIKHCNETTDKEKLRLSLYDNFEHLGSVSVDDTKPTFW